MRRYAKPVQDHPPGRMGRPPRLTHRDEWELYCYRKAGVSIKGCASFFRVSVPTANRIIAKFREIDERVEPLAREFRDNLNSLGSDAVKSVAAVDRVASLRPIECERALRLMQTAQNILIDLAERGLIEAGSAPDSTRAYLDDAIGMLTPETPEDLKEIEEEESQMLARRAARLKVVSDE